MQPDLGDLKGSVDTTGASGPGIKVRRDTWQQDQHQRRF